MYQINLSYDNAFSELLSDLEQRYGKEIFEIEGIGSQLDISAFSKNFFSNKQVSDASIDENANVSENCIITYKKEATKPIYKLNSLYILWRLLRKDYGTSIANSIIEKQINGELYLNDAWMVISPYCFNYSCIDIINKGLPMVKKIKSHPPKYLFSFKSQLEQFIILAANSTLGATGIADLLLCMSYYVKNIIETQSDGHFHFRSEDDCWIYVRETLASLIYTLNQPMRASESPFTNVSIYDDYFIEESKQLYIFPDLSQPDTQIVKKLQKIFLDVMNSELSRTPFTFPVTTACFSIDKENNIKDEEFARFIAEENQKFGFINIFMGDTSLLSSCCRLVSDNSNGYLNSIGGSSSKIGSLSVCTINLPRITYITKTEEEFFTKLEEQIRHTGKINNCRRKMIQRKIDEGYMPLYTYGFMDLGKQYSTVGINGMYEAMLELGYDISTPIGLEFAKKLASFISDQTNKLQKTYNTPHNCEVVPGESASVKLAKKDKLLGLNTKYIIYQNQFFPLVADMDILDRIKIQGQLDGKFSGGSIMHVNVENNVPIENMVELIKICAKRGVRYFALNYNIQVCEN
ncbi:MAG: anaerobic ribonucleoside-triphosphate reductase, partial [Candidatus Pacebacteria bacterium]|nr:anaerobic ribonucleoside-triphosphate reductase [Candidatus Paceibacterota bacterium]